MTNDRKMAIYVAVLATTFYPMLAWVAFTSPVPSGGWVILWISAVLMVVAIGYWRVNR